MAAIEVRALTKRYGSLQAVRGVDLSVADGEVFALLGPNGAGKTTTVEILEGHRSRTSGTASVLGFDPERGGREFRQRIGIVLQAAGIDRRLTVRETLELYAPIYRRSLPVAEVVSLVGLEAKVDARVGTLSGGQRRRLDLALGLIGDPDLLFLDEPTTGFDPSARRRAWSTIGELRALGTTVLLTTHYMEEAERLADRVALMVGGRIVAEGSPERVGEVAGLRTSISFDLPPGMGRSGLPPGPPFEVRGTRVELLSDQPTADLHLLTGWALERGVELGGLRVERPSLEEAYLALISGEEDDG